MPHAPSVSLLQRAPRAIVALAAAAALACASSPPAQAPAPPPPVASPAPAAPAPQRSEPPPGPRTPIPREYVITVETAGPGEPVVRYVFGRLGIDKVQELRKNVFLVTFTNEPGLDKVEAIQGIDKRIVDVQQNYAATAR